MAERADLLRFTLGPFQANAYVLIGPSARRAVVVDPGLEASVLVEALRARSLDVDWILDTHGHVDHVAGNAELVRATKAPTFDQAKPNIYRMLQAKELERATGELFARRSKSATIAQ